MSQTTATVPRDVRMLGVPWSHPAFVYLSGLSSGARPTQIVALASVARFLGYQGIADCPWHELDVPRVAAIRSWVAERYAPKTANRFLGVVRSIARACAQLGTMPRERAHAIGEVAPVGGRSEPRGRALEPSEVVSILEHLERERSTANARTAAAIGLCYGGGLRRAEAAGLRLEHLEQRGTVARVRGKGGVERLVPLPDGSRRILGRWLAIRGVEPGPVLCRIDRDGECYPADHVQPQNVFAWFARAAREIGLPHFSPHDLRRTYVGDLLDVGGDLPTVQQLVGHANPATTARYDRRPARARAAAVAGLDALPWAHVHATRPPSELEALAGAELRPRSGNPRTVLGLKGADGPELRQRVGARRQR